jgi:hypothetical protein
MNCAYSCVFTMQRTEHVEERNSDRLTNRELELRILRQLARAGGVYVVQSDALKR